MLIFDKVSAGYGKNRILKDVSFSVPDNRLTALIGKNGSGKSTAIACVNGSLRYSGRISVGGISISELSPREKAKKIAVLPQLLPQTPFSVCELVSLGRGPYLPVSGRFTKEDAAQVEGALRFCGLEALRDRPVNRLSGGERQRAYLAMTIARNADILILDEATTFMDAAFEAEFYRLLRRMIREQGKTVLAVMHNLSRCANEADAIVLMEQGSVIQKGETGQVVASGEIESVFGVQKKVFLDGKVPKYVYI